MVFAFIKKNIIWILAIFLSFILVGIVGVLIILALFILWKINDTKKKKVDIKEEEVVGIKKEVVGIKKEEVDIKEKIYNIDLSVFGLTDIIKTDKLTIAIKQMINKIRTSKINKLIFITENINLMNIIFPMANNIYSKYVLDNPKYVININQANSIIEEYKNILKYYMDILYEHSYDSKISSTYSIVMMSIYGMRRLYDINNNLLDFYDEINPNTILRIRGVYYDDIFSDADHKPTIKSIKDKFVDYDNNRTVNNNVFKKTKNTKRRLFFDETIYIDKIVYDMNNYLNRIYGIDDSTPMDDIIYDKNTYEYLLLTDNYIERHYPASLLDTHKLLEITQNDTSTFANLYKKSVKLYYVHLSYAFNSSKKTISIYNAIQVLNSLNHILSLSDPKTISDLIGSSGDTDTIETNKIIFIIETIIYYYDESISSKYDSIIKKSKDNLSKFKKLYNKK